MHSFRDDADEDAESWRISASSHEDEAYALGSRSGEDGRSAEVPRSAEERAVYDEEEGKFVEGGEEGAWSDGEGEEGDEGEWTDHACVDRSAAHSYSTRSRSRVRVRQVESQPSPPRT